MGSLPVGDIDYLKPCKDDAVLIIGHPGAGGPGNDAPMRFDWGKERIVESHQQRVSWGIEEAVVKERILYDLVTLGGNSGSPVFGRGGKVKGIHIQGGGPGTGPGVNKAQIMDHIVSGIKERVKDFNKKWNKRGAEEAFEKAEGQNLGLEI